MMAVSSKPPIIPSTTVMGFDSSQRFRFRAVAKVTIVDNDFLISRRKEEDGARFGGLEFELNKLRKLRVKLSGNLGNVKELMKNEDFVEAEKGVKNLKMALGIGDVDEERKNKEVVVNGLLRMQWLPALRRFEICLSSL